jgi:hypothetical protein
VNDRTDTMLALVDISQACVPYGTNKNQSVVKFN